MENEVSFFKQEIALIKQELFQFKIERQNDVFNIVDWMWKENGNDVSLLKYIEFISKSQYCWDMYPNKVWLIYIFVNRK